MSPAGLRACAALWAVAGCAGRPDLPPARLDQPRKLDLEHRAELFRGTNGLTFLFLPDHRTNLVKVDVRYRVGAKEDPRGKAGLAHLVEHMAFQIRPPGSDRTIEESLAGTALYHNATTTWDATEYSAVAARERLDELLAVEAARMSAGCAELDAAAFAREREVVRNELRERGGVGAAMAQALLTSVYGAGHAYGRLPGGTDAELAGLSLSDVCTFLERYYASQRAIVVVTGDIEVEPLRARVAAIFGSIAPRAAEPLAPVAPLHLRGTSSRHTMEVVEATAFVAFPAPPPHGEGAPVTDVLVPLLEQDLAEMVREHAWVSDVAVTRFGGELAPIHVVVVSVTDPRRLADAVAAVHVARDAFVTELRRDLARRAGNQQLRASTNRRRAELVAAVEPFFQRGPAFADYLQFTRHNWFVLRDLALLARLDRGQVWERLPTMFRRDESHVAYVYPRPGTAARARRVSLPAVDRPDELLTARAPVDAAEAERPVALAARRVLAGVETMEVRGMRVILVRRDDVPLLDARIIFRSGSADEPADRPGTALLAGTLLDHDSGRRYEQKDYWTIARVLAMGVVADAEVNEHATMLRMTGLSVFTDGLLWQLAWLVESGVYEHATLDRLQDLLGRRTPQRADEMREASRSALLYGRGHPYARQAGIAALRRLEIRDLERFRRDRYRLGGATLIVTGRFEPAEMRRRIRELWDRDTPAAGAPLAGSPVPPARPRPAHLAVADDEEPQVEVALDVPLASGFDEHAARTIAAELIERRLERLRTRFGSTYGVHASIQSRPGPGLLSIVGRIDSERAAETFAAMQRELAELRRGDDQLAADFVRARRRVLEQLLARQGDSSSVAAELTFCASHGLPIHHFDRLADQVAAMTLARFRQHLAGMLSLERVVAFARGPRASVAALYRAAGVAGVQWLR